MRLDDYHYLVITTDSENPLGRVNETFLPELLRPKLSGYHMDCINDWKQWNNHFSWLNYKKMKELIEKIEEQFPLGSLFLPTYELNKANLGLQISQREEEDEEEGNGLKHIGRGVSLIYAPEIYPTTFLHFSWLERNCAIRDYSKSEFHQPIETRYNTSYVENLIQQEITVKKRQPIHDISFWHNLIIETNRNHLSKFEN